MKKKHKITHHNFSSQILIKKENTIFKCWIWTHHLQDNSKVLDAAATHVKLAGHF